MLTIKIGFLPSNWESWDANAATGGKWAGGMRDRCVVVLKKIPGISLVVPGRELTPDGCVGSYEDAQKTAELFLRERIQGLIIGNMTFGMETAVGALLSRMPKDLPILHFTTKSGPIGEDGARSTDTWCGGFMTASAIKRRGFKFIHLLPCNPEDEAFTTEMALFSRAVNAIARFKGARFAQIGTRPALFESQFFSEENMQKQFSQMVIPMDLASAFSRMDAVKDDDPEVLAALEEIRGGAEIGDECTGQPLLNQARYEISLRRIMKELHADAMAVNCWTEIQTRYGISSCSTFARLNEKGYTVACEADLLGAVTMHVMNCLSLKEARADFIDWTDLHPTEKNVWLAWHCGNAAPSLCASGCRKKLLRNQRMIQWVPECHGALEFRLQEGPVACARMVEYNGRYTFFTGNGTVIDIPPFIRGSYGWVKVNNIEDWEKKMVACGIIHHGTLIYDPAAADALKIFCKFMDIDYVRGE